jgi:hypothetical protein
LAGRARLQDGLASSAPPRSSAEPSPETPVGKR